MTYEGPKTVTFGAAPADEAQHRSARLGSKVLGGTLGTAAAMLTLVACLFALKFAISLSTTWPETAILSLILVAGALTLTGLPIAGAVVARSYPAETRHIMRAWVVVFGMATGGIAAFVAQLDPVERKLASPGTSAARIEAGVSDVVWRYSKRCKAPENAAQREACMRFDSALANAEAPDDWSPRHIFSIAASTDDGPARYALIGALALLATAGAGFLGRWAVLSMSETYRLGYGEASALPASGGVPLARVEASAGGSAMTPADVFSVWANSRLVPSPGGTVQGQMGYDDYSQTCMMNGVQPMSLTKWGLLMTARAESSQGRVIKEKVSGKVVYKGWTLASDLGAIGGEPVAQITKQR